MCCLCKVGCLDRWYWCVVCVFFGWGCVDGCMCLMGGLCGLFGCMNLVGLEWDVECYVLVLCGRGGVVWG